MASIVQRPNGNFRCQIRFKGVRESKEFKSKRAAQFWGVEREKAIAESGGAGPEKRTMAECLLVFESEFLPARRSRETERGRLKPMYGWPMVDLPVSALTLEILEDFIEQRLLTVTGSTVRREMGLLRTVFRLALKIRKGKPNPLDGLELPPENKPRKITPTTEQIGRMVDVLGHTPGGKPQNCDQFVALMLLWACQTGMRRGEILQLRRCDVNVEARSAIVIKSKNGEQRNVPLTSAACEMIAPVLVGQRGSVAPIFKLSLKSFKRGYGHARRVTNVEHLHFHDTRRTACTMLAKHLSPLELMRALGHKDIKMTMIYYAPDVSEIAQKLP